MIIRFLTVSFSVLLMLSLGCSDDAGAGSAANAVVDGGATGDAALGESTDGSPSTGSDSIVGKEGGGTSSEGGASSEGGGEGEEWGDVGSSGEDGEGPCVLGEAEFECPCAQNIDCLSGFCVEGPDGSICTDACLTECPGGFSCQGVSNLGPDVVFICIPDSLKLCKACTSDTQCGSSGKCAAFDDGNYCTQDCSENECKGGYVCAENDVEANGGFAEQCVPESGACDCTPDLYGETRPCLSGNDFGQCFGTETCEQGQGWSNCTALEPMEEMCNGQDDDCDGIADEELSQGEACSDGPCDGVLICSGVEGWACTAQVPGDELCDYVDNDCDGQTDEDFKDETSGAYMTLDNCGSCGKSCINAFPNATAKCDGTGEPPQCIVATCDAGFFALNEFQCIPQAADLCQPCATDSDCIFGDALCLELTDGLYCGKACEVEEDCPAGYSCQDFDGNQQCAPVGGTCGCDGTNLSLSKSCTVTYVDPIDPDAPVSTCTGSEACTEVGWGECVLPEDVCDGQDNNCDGTVDGAFINGESGLYETDNHCGKCGNNCTAINFTNGSGFCQVTDDIPGCGLLCDILFFDVNQNPSDGCECEYISDVDLPDLFGNGENADANCDGVDGEIENGIFVAKNGNDANLGTIDAPILTLGKALSTAVETGKRDVYVATGVYQESLLLESGIGVYGGYSSDFLQRDKVLYETVIFGTAPSGDMLGAINCLDLSADAGAGIASAFDGFTVFGYDTNGSSESSYGIYLSNCGSQVSVTNNTIYGGDGGNGALGSPGSAGGDGVSGTSGLIAKNAGANCSGTTTGGGGGSKTCGGQAVSGGSGGNAICPDYDQSGQQPYSDPATQSSSGQENGGNGQGAGGSGGEAGWDFLTYFLTSGCNSCSIPPESHEWVGADGEAGVAGPNGQSGAGCGNSEGSVQNGVWVGGGGGAGGDGGDGSGGGGGGAGGGVEVVGCFGEDSDVGASGGGGGSGACGANPGASGKAGGGSFGIFVVYSEAPGSIPAIEGNIIYRGSGGNGGNGGSGGVGGIGGAGGAGGQGGAQVTGAFCAAGGGYGASGGNGGHGGGGGGGCGGASYGVFASGTGGWDLSPYSALNSYPGAGSAGIGGLGGASFGAAGEDGFSGASAPVNF